MFIPADIYTTSGSLKLYHCWTDKVTKFDSSSFYNWEQDNLPVYDLDERTFYLWEQLGYPTSAIPGVALVVSADAPDSAVTCNKNIFRTVSAAIEALPQTINYPIIIEVANFGSLGNLVLNNYKFGPRGSLEIINRNYSKQEQSLSSAGTVLGYVPQVSANYYQPDINVHLHVSSFSLYGNTAYPALRETAPLQGFLDSSCLSISAAVFSGTRDSRLSGAGGTLNGYISVLKVGAGNFTNYNKATLIVDSKNNTQPYTSDNYGIAFTPYYFNPDASDDIYNKDASTVDYLDSNQIKYLANDSTTLYLNSYHSYNGLYYANKLSKVYINNCDGPIFIRNFFLDGGGSNSTTNQYGVEINNSPNIYLENIVVSRFRKAGYYFNNSKINILRSCVANRIYDFDSAGNRLTGNYASRRNFISYNDSSGYLAQDLGAGLLANNSYINFSSTRDWEAVKYAELISADGYEATPTAYTVIEFNENANGIILNNCTLTGGDSCRSSDLLKVHGQTVFDFNSNVNCGLISNNSKVSLNGRMRFCENLKGAEFNNSILEMEEFECKRNQSIGLELNNSKAIYNKNLLRFQINGIQNPAFGIQFPYVFDFNGNNLVLNSSEFKPMMTSSMELRYYLMVFQNTLGYLNSDIISESIKVSNNSNLILISPQLERDATHSIQDKAKKGSEINCTNNSKATIRGTGVAPALIFGPNTRIKHKNLAAICANENSTIEINGPTKICQFGIDLLADKNSTINITPSKSEFDNVIDTSSITLSNPANHTMVELHSTRSCIVVDNNSTLNMKDLGSFRQNWSATTYFDSSGPDYGGATDTVYNSTYVSAGSLQFYPNPNSSDTDSAASAANIYLTFTKYANAYGALLPLNSTNLNFSAVTYGGMCVRAVNNSIVNVHNVNFPCGWWNASAPYYDQEITFDSGGACYRPFIWNIADTSQLKASFLSVSGKYPRLAGYVGPYGYWPGVGTAAASGLPAGTPDTSSMSILDIYGANPSGHPFTSVTATNYGPFRLYFGTNPFVNSLVEHNGGGQGIIRQIYSQGYQPSTTLVCSGDLSGIYKMSLQRNSNNNIAASGFYYGSGVMDTNGHLRVILDESAAETFANAKHCSAGKSGNAKLVSIYYPYTVANQGDSRNNKGVVSVNLFDIERDN